MGVEKTLTDDVKRWLNIFVMNGKQVNEHGISTGVRGGATNVPDPDECNGVYPCEARFQRFYVNNTDSNGRLYKKNLMKMVCTARKFGDRGGEYSYSSGSIHLPGGGDLIPVPAREWQMKGAILGWLNAFGRKDEKGEWYMHIDDARKMLMEGHLPKGWKKRSWGCLSGLPGDSCDEAFIKQVNEKVECDVSEDAPWWEGTGLQVATGHKCRFGRCDGCDMRRRQLHLRPWQQLSRYDRQKWQVRRTQRHLHLLWSKMRSDRSYWPQRSWESEGGGNTCLALRSAQSFQFVFGITDCPSFLGSGCTGCSLAPEQTILLFERALGRDMYLLVRVWFCAR